MIVQKLPGPGRSFGSQQDGVFADHTLFTEKTDFPYYHPRQRAGLGILSLVSGKGECQLHRKKEMLDSHSYLVVNRGSEFTMSLPQAGTQPFFLFFRTKLIHQAPEALSCLERRHSKQGLLGERLQWLARLGNSCSSFTALKADSIIRSILEELVSQAYLAGQAAGRLKVARQATRIELFKRLSLAREWIQENYSSPITLSDMARIATLNSQHFLRMFRQCYLITPHQFLIGIRLEQAKQRLLHSTDAIAAICQATGFESLSSFSGAFKERYGLPPSLFRQGRPGTNSITSPYP